MCGVSVGDFYVVEVSFVLAVVDEAVKFNPAIGF